MFPEAEILAVSCRSNGHGPAARRPWELCGVALVSCVCPLVTLGSCVCGTGSVAPIVPALGVHSPGSRAFLFASLRPAMHPCGRAVDEHKKKKEKKKKKKKKKK